MQLKKIQTTHYPPKLAHSKYTSPSKSSSEKPTRSIIVEQIKDASCDDTQ